MSKKTEQNKIQAKIEYWAVARMMYENTSANYREISNSLRLMFGDSAPSHTSIFKHAKQENWNKFSPSPITIDGSTGEILSTTQQKIQAKMDSIVADSETKKQKIIKHRKRLERLGDFQDEIMDSIDEMMSLNVAEYADEIKNRLFVNKTLTEMLGTLTGTQKIIAEQEFALYQITPEDFGQSDAEKRATSLALLGNISEEEQQARNAQLPELIARLNAIEKMNLDDMAIDDDEF